jgi:hypothetical protein
MIYQVSMTIILGDSSLLNNFSAVYSNCNAAYCITKAINNFTLNVTAVLSFYCGATFPT